MPKDLLDHPVMAPYRERLLRLPQRRFPAAADLQVLFDSPCLTFSGQRVAFVPDDELPPRSEDAGYEREIARSGRISTRRNSLHDLCNALVWATFPKLKAMLNQRHLLAPPAPEPGTRGPVRDAITGFDECGALVLCPRRTVLDTLARHDWPGLFGEAGGAWPGDLKVIVVGHATLEMFWAPYKAMTCRCLLVESDLVPDRLQDVDALAASLWSTEGAIDRPACLCPLPIMGIPGWWPGLTPPGFWADTEVFRPPRPGRAVPPIYPPGG
ncbi:MAG: DUF3025 domain-containing protein [Xanthomonadales bacterium]|nr:DUF3025 domain-containing protein [Xanthomonadales bacterium]